MIPFLDDGDVRVFHGDCREVLKGFADASFDAIVTDPPYGLGFMGKEWDTPGRAARATSTSVDAADSPYARGRAEFGGASYGGGFLAATRGFQSWCQEWATECLRVLKPGGHLLAFGGTRTYHRLVCGVEDAGFEIRDYVEWLYGQGFPKSHNVSKAIDKGLPDDAPPSAEAEAWEGWGTALKPAHEPIMLARKPLDGTVAANVLEHGTGGLNIAATQIGGAPRGTHAKGTTGAASIYGSDVSASREMGELPDGRWPSNVILSHTSDCEQRGTQKVKAITGMSRGNPDGNGIFGKGFPRGDGRSTSKGDEDGMEVVEVWACSPECPVRLLDEQTGDLGVSSGTRAGSIEATPAFGAGMQRDGRPTGLGDRGGASRFFYTAKASKGERNEGLAHLPDGSKAGQSTWGRTCNVCGVTFVDPATGEPKCGHGDFSWTQTGSAKNTHPTVKPVEVMRWLLRMVTPPGGLVLDPFAGSGTTAVACRREGFNCVLIEREEEYLPIISGRLSILTLGV